MSHDEFFAVDTAARPWEGRYNPTLGREIFRKDLYTDPETGAEIRLKLESLQRTGFALPRTFAAGMIVTPLTLSYGCP